MSTIAPDEIPHQPNDATSALAAATGRIPKTYRRAGGLSNAALRGEAGRQGLAEITSDADPFDSNNDCNIAGTVYMLRIRITADSMVLLHDT